MPIAGLQAVAFVTVILLAAVPVPPPRPPELAAPPETPAPQAPPADDGTTELTDAEKACRGRLAELGAVAEPLPPLRGEGDCGAPAPLRLVRLTPAIATAGNPVATCRLAEALSLWARDGVAPAAAAMGTTVTTVTIGTSYQCRGRNRVAGAKLSEHAFANGVDVASFHLGDGRTVTVGSTVENGFQLAVRQAACAVFTTVLGPGSPEHADHLHLDMQQRRNDYRICE